MLAHPRHAGELGPVSDFVQRQPQTEFLGWERIALFEHQDVGRHVVDDVLVFGVLILNDQQVVLAEHPRRHPAEHCAEFGTRNLGTENGFLAVHLVFKLGGDRFQEPLKAGEVGVDPTLTVGDTATRLTVERPETGALGDEVLCHRRVAGKVLFEPVAVPPGPEGLTPRDLRSDRAGDVPVDGATHVSPADNACTSPG